MANSFIIRHAFSDEGLQLLNVSTNKLYSTFSNYPSVCYDSNNSRFLSLIPTSEGTFSYKSNNGQSWEPLNSEPAQIAGENFRCLTGGTYKGYLFSSQNINLYRSKDEGKTWDLFENTGIEANEHAPVAYNPNTGIIVSGGYNGTMIYSENGGDIWKKGTAVAGYILAIIYIPSLSKFISCGTSGKLYTSENGKAWTALSSPANVQFNSIVYADSGTYDKRLVVCDSDGQTYYSTNMGSSWNTGGIATSTSFGDGLAYGNNVFVALRAGGTDFLKYSTDGAATWENSNISGVNSVVFDKNTNTFVAVGQYGGMWYSTNGQTWTSSNNFKVMPVINSLCKGSNNRLFAIGYYGYTCYSDDGGKSWQSNGFLGNNSWSACSYANNMLFVFGAYDGTMQYSDNNGATWTPCTGLEGIVSSMAFGNSVFVAIANSVVYKSTDGKSWTKQTTFPTDLQSVVYNDGKFTAVDNYSKVFQSQNGVSWTQKDQVFDGYAYNAKLYVFSSRLIYVKPGDGMMGTGTIVYYSENNGSTWKRLGGSIGASSFGVDSKSDGTLFICGNNSAYYNIDNAIVALNCDITNVSNLVYISEDGGFISVGSDGIDAVSLKAQA